MMITFDRFDGKKKRIGSRETQEKQRLVHHYKKELKGAIRNLRQDNMFLAREKLQEQIERCVCVCVCVYVCV